MTFHEMAKLTADDAPSPRRSKFDYREIEALEEQAKTFKEYAPLNKLAAKFSGLCFHCKWSTIIRTQRMNEPLIKCAELSQQVPSDVVECNSYRKITDMGLASMAELAWPIEIRDHLKDGYR